MSQRKVSAGAGSGYSVAQRATYHHGNLREAIVAAAVELVAESGIEAMTLREAARRAGVSSGAPFRHFPGKRELVLAVAEQGMAQLRASIVRGLSDCQAENPLVRLAMLGSAYVDWASDHPTHYRVLGDRLLIDFYQSEALLADNRFIRETMEQLLREGQEQGQIGPIDLGQANLQCRAMAYGLARMMVDGHFPEFAISSTTLIRQTMVDALDGMIALLASDSADTLEQIRTQRRIADVNSPKLGWPGPSDS